MNGGVIMNRTDIEKMVEDLVMDIIKDTELELIDVEYVKEHSWYLRVFLTKPTGLDLEDCLFVSIELEQKLDQLHPI